MTKVKKNIKKINENFTHIFTSVVMLMTLFEFDFNLMIAYFIYMTYSAYILWEEFIRNHRMTMNMQYRDFLDKRGLKEEPIEEREGE